MDQDKADPAQRPQTLLEAAAAMIDWWGIGSMPDQIRSLKAAIAREEDRGTIAAKSRSLADWWCDEARKQSDRAQQAEADAAWHKAESARLSAELAKERDRTVSTATTWRRQVDQVREEAEAAPDEPTIDAITSLRQRAEKAEAELAEAKQARQLDRAVDVLTRIEPRDPTTGFTFATYRRVVEALGGKS